MEYRQRSHTQLVRGRNGTREEGMLFVQTVTFNSARQNCFFPNVWHIADRLGHTYMYTFHQRSQRGDRVQAQLGLAPLRQVSVILKHSWAGMKHTEDLAHWAISKGMDRKRKGRGQTEDGGRQHCSVPSVSSCHPHLFWYDWATHQRTMLGHCTTTKQSATVIHDGNLGCSAYSQLCVTFL